jgi:hypothetical protein
MGLAQQYNSRFIFSNLDTIPGTSEPEVYHGFPQSLQENVEGILPLAHNRFLSYPFQFIVNLSSYYLTLYRQATDSVVEQPTEIQSSACFSC